MRRLDPPTERDPPLPRRRAYNSRRTRLHPYRSARRTPRVQRQSLCYWPRSVPPPMQQSARADHDHRPALPAAIPPQLHHLLLRSLPSSAGTSHLALDHAVPDHQEPAANGPGRSPATRAGTRPRSGTRRHSLTPGLDPERACDKSRRASCSSNRFRSTTERAGPSKETPSPSPFLARALLRTGRIPPPRPVAHPRADRRAHQLAMHLVQLVQQSPGWAQLRGALTPSRLVLGLRSRHGSPVLVGTIKEGTT